MPDDKGLDFSPEFMDKYRFLQRERAVRIQKLEEQARKKAREIAAVLKEKYGVSKVYLYGSLAWGGFTEGSDIDLLITGYQGHDFWKMYVEAERTGAPFEISLVCEEDAHPSLRKAVIERGILL
jgi:predicted nucleotidyltransferase